MWLTKLFYPFFFVFLSNNKVNEWCKIFCELLWLIDWYMVVMIWEKLWMIDIRYNEVNRYISHARYQADFVFNLLRFVAFFQWWLTIFCWQFWNGPKKSVQQMFDFEYLFTLPLNYWNMKCAFVWLSGIVVIVRIILGFCFFFWVGIGVFFVSIVGRVKSRLTANNWLFL